MKGLEKIDESAIMKVEQWKVEIDFKGTKHGEKF